MSSPRPMAMEGPGPFRWNRGAWFGTLLGSTAWMAVGAAALAARSPGLAACWLACFAVAVGVGVWLWGRRDRIRPYPAIQGMLVAVGLCGLLAMATLDLFGPETAAGLVGSSRVGYRAMLIVPALMAWFALMDRVIRPQPPPADPT